LPDLYSLEPIDAPSLYLRLGLALIVGILIGGEREIKNKPAGLRTHMLVCFGSSLFVLLPIQLGLAVQNPETLSRVMSGIISGVGFIGAGTILRDRKVRGLTSAAAIWVSAALGTAIGCGLWKIALTSALICWFILRIVKRLESESILHWPINLQIKRARRNPDGRVNEQ
jgi:putative Mg2+ transporter-C (MgtC) family protein